MKFRIPMHVVIEARDERDAIAQAKKIEGLLKQPLVRMSIASEGVQLAGGDGRPVVYSPQRDGA